MDHVPVRGCSALVLRLEEGSAGRAALRPLTHHSSSAAPPRHSTFFRVWAFLILEFHFMAVMLWGWDSMQVRGRVRHEWDGWWVVRGRPAARHALPDQTAMHAQTRQAVHLNGTPGVPLPHNRIQPASRVQVPSMPTPPTHVWLYMPGPPPS